MSYSDDSFFEIQKKALAMQKRMLAKKKRESKARPDVRPEVRPAQDISIFESLDKLENDIQLSKKELDEYVTRHGNATTRPIPNLHQISPLSRSILSELKKVNFSDVSENQLRELNTINRRIAFAWLGDGPSAFPASMNALIQKGRPIDNSYRRLHAIATADIRNLIDYIATNLSNVKGHNYLKGSGIPKRFL
jgi:hypothetical protein